MYQKKITDKQQAIITLLPRFRFLTRTHIQYFMHHKDRQRINKWLNDLTTNHYLRRYYDHSIIGKNRRPAVFSLHTNGIRFVRSLGMYDESFLHTLYFEKNRSELFQEHCLLIATICCDLAAKTHDSLCYDYATASDVKLPDNPYHFLEQTGLDIDLVFQKKETGHKTKNYLLFLFDESLPKYRIRKRVRDILSFHNSNVWENNVTRAFPTILIVCWTKERMIYTKRYIKNQLASEPHDDVAIYLTIAEEVIEQSVTGIIWEGI